MFTIPDESIPESKADAPDSLNGEEASTTVAIGSDQIDSLPMENKPKLIAEKMTPMTDATFTAEADLLLLDPNVASTDPPDPPTTVLLSGTTDGHTVTSNIDSVESNDIPDRINATPEPTIAERGSEKDCSEVSLENEDSQQEILSSGSAIEGQYAEGESNEQCPEVSLITSENGVTGEDKSIEQLVTPIETLEPSATEEKSTEQSISHTDSKSHSKQAIDNSDVASRAAMALAAVAAAATANNVSPSAAAEAARALAPGLVPESATSTLPMKGDNQRRRDIQFVNVLSVKECLRVRFEQTRRLNHDHVGDYIDTAPSRDPTSHVAVNQRLAKGENDAFLRHLLMLEYYMTEDPGAEIPKSPFILQQESIAKEQQVPKVADFDPDDTIEHDTALAASEKVRSMLSMAEDAYDAMEALLPRMPLRERRDTEGSDPFFGMESQHVIPDLLPPCTSAKGDASSQFFWACTGDVGVNNKQTEGKDVVAETYVYSSPKVESELTSKSSPSMLFKSMFSSMTTRTKISPVTKHTLGSVFGGKRQPQEILKKDHELDLNHETESTDDLNCDYSVIIDREMLGLTVENVLERTVVRTVLTGGAAKKSGARVGSLLVKVGNVETKNLTHFETIDELRHSIRPLKLFLKPISSDVLRAAREEMGRLIRGGGFGTSLPIDQEMNENNKVESPARKPAKVEAFSQVLHQRWNADASMRLNKKDQALLLAGEKLVWILTLLVIGLEREAAKSLPTSTETSFEMSSRRHSSHSAEDYADSAKSVSKVLFDFINLSVQTMQGDMKRNATGSLFDNNAMGRKTKNLPPPPPTGRIKLSNAALVKSPSTQALLRIGDVLHRTRTFLADPTSPPAAMLRGEVIAFLCDVLDIDSDMELSEEEATLASGGGFTGGSINDLGSAGSLLKLMILNCSMMRSPECAALASQSSQADSDFAEELKRHMGLKRQTSFSDVHRFHAGNRFLAVVHRLAASRSISARITACSLSPVLWGHLDFPHQLQLRGVITRALHDVDVIVRKSTATVLHEIAELVFDPRAVPWLVLMCERAMTDPEPQLRAAAMTLTWHLSEHLPNAFLGDASQGSRSVRRLPPRDDPTFAEVYLLQCKLLPVATRLAEDQSPAVRLAVAAQCDRLCSALGDHWYRIIIDVLQALLGDVDERVRGEAILCVPRLAEIILMSTSDKTASCNIGVLEALLPVTIKLQKDSSVEVRVALATTAGELLTLLVGLESLEEISPPGVEHSTIDVGLKGYKKHVDETLVPLLQQLLHDNVPEVTSSALRAVTNASRGNVRELRGRKKSVSTEDDNVSLSSSHSRTSLEKKDPVFIPVLSETQVLRLLPTLAALAISREWRVRQGAVEIVPALLGCTHRLETRMEIAQLCFRLMSDHVDAVRRTAAECLCLGGGGLGSQGEATIGWINTVVIPHIEYCCRSPDSKQRMLSLKMTEVILINGLCPSKCDAGEKSTQRALVELALSLATDRVANVRLNVGRLFCTILGMLEDEEVALAITALQGQLDAEQKREHGVDRDVIYFAKRAIQRAEEVSCSSLREVSSLDDSHVFTG